MFYWQKAEISAGCTRTREDVRRFDWHSTPRHRAQKTSGIFFIFPQINRARRAFILPPFPFSRSIPVSLCPSFFVSQSFSFSHVLVVSRYERAPRKISARCFDAPLQLRCRDFSTVADRASAPGLVRLYNYAKRDTITAEKEMKRNQRDGGGVPDRHI